MKLLLLLSGVVLATQKFLIEINSTPQTDCEHVYNNFFRNEEKNIIDEFNFGQDLTGFVMEYSSFPYHLYEYSFVKSVELDHSVSVNSPFGDFILDDFLHFYPINKPETSILNMTYSLQLNPIWNLDRIDQRPNELNNKYFYSTSGGKGVNAFIIDTGVSPDNTKEFQDRAKFLFNSVDNIDADCNGHGTHVSGIIGSTSYGVAKNVNLLGVKVLNCDGSGSYSSVIKGMEFVLNYVRSESEDYHNKNNPKSSIVNMSLGGPKSLIINKAVKALTDAGIHVVVAAGNESQDACDTSPASEPSAITVGASDTQNNMAFFSNGGLCVNIFGPGVQVLSTTPGNSTEVLEGSSQSSPHIVGVVALKLADNALISPIQMKKILTDDCTKNVLGKVTMNTPNCLVYSM